MVRCVGNGHKWVGVGFGFALKCVGESRADRVGLWIRVWCREVMWADVMERWVLFEQVSVNLGWFMMMWGPAL